MANEQILVVEDDELMLDFMEEALQSRGYQVLKAENAGEGMNLFKERDPALIVADIKMPGDSGIDFLSEVRELDQRIPVIMMTAYAETDTAIEALRNMADDFIKKPFEAPEILEAVERHLQRDTEAREVIEQYQPVYASTEMEQLIDRARDVAEEFGPVLIEGESGVGKEVLARFIHYQSPRSKNPMVTVNCGAIPGELLESELFGHKKGAFTGATEDRQGLFLAADSGTLFLDEIGELPSGLQAKLLRVLEQRQIKPVGSDETRSVDVRVIAASNQDLRQQVENNYFREDLFYRLNVFQFTIPPLRERPADILPLLRHFCDRFSVDVEFDEQLLDTLKNYPWPGNVRQLQNMVRRLRTEQSGTVVDEDTVRKTGLNFDGKESDSVGKPSFPPTPDLKTVLKTIKSEYITRALRESGGNKSEAARILGMNRTTLVETMNRLEINSGPAQGENN